MKILKTPRPCGSELAHEEAGAVAENLYIRDSPFASKLAPTRSALPHEHLHDLKHPSPAGVIHRA
ncbi:hypothetical protein GIW78_18370 [Pseudomonas syringae]|nr:hypothetical protein [Pseudomonas syringae]